MNPMPQPTEGRGVQRRLDRRRWPAFLAVGGVAAGLILMAVGFQPRWIPLTVLAASLATFLAWTLLLVRRLAGERDGTVALAEDLHRSRERLASVFDGLADGITVQDAEGNLIHANDAAAKAIGFSSAAELLTTPVSEVLARFEILDEDGRPFPLERLPGRLALTSEQPAAQTLRYRDRATGGERWSLVRATPLRDPDGRVRHAINVFQDITEERWQREASRILAQISQELLASSLDYEGTLRLLAELVVPRFADVASVFLVRDGVPRRVQIVHRDREAQAEILRLASEADPSTADHPVNAVIASKEPLLLQKIPDETLTSGVPDPRDQEIVRELGLGSAMIVPLIAHGEALGALVLVTTGERRRYDQEDLEVAVDLAGRAALAVENARLHMEEQEARHVAEAAAVRMARLQLVTSKLAAASRVEEVADALLGHAGEALEASSGSLVMLEEGKLRLLGSVGLSEETTGRWETFPLDAPVPIAEAARTGQPVLIGDAEHLREAYPHLTGVGEPDGKAWAALPLLSASGEVLGAIGLTFGEPRAFPDEERGFLRTVSEQCSQALERARLFEKEHEARSHAVLQQERLNFLAEAGEILSGSLRYERTIEHLLQLCVPRLGDWCIVDVLEPDGSIQMLSEAHVDPQKNELVRELRRRYPPDRPDHPIRRVIETGNPEMQPFISEEELRATASDEDHAQILRELGLTGVMVVPLIARQRILGALSFISGSSGRRYTPADLALAEILGRRAALAFDNARLYQERSQLARSLQQSLLPARLPRVPGAEIAARYRPAPEGDVGGDFYDVFELSDGRWGLVIGDVAGKGPEAAALTALARHTIRTAWLEEGRDPDDILRILHGVMLREESERFCTLLIGALDPSGQAHRLVLASGGHPSPLVLRSDGSVEEVRIRGMLVGALAEADFGRREVTLGPGETLLMYTDGIGDVGRPSQVPIEARLAELLRLCVGLDADLTASRIERHAASFEGAMDDAALLVVRILG